MCNYVAYNRFYQLRFLHLLHGRGSTYGEHSDRSPTHHVLKICVHINRTLIKFTLVKVAGASNYGTGENHHHRQHLINIIIVISILSTQQVTHFYMHVAVSSGIFLAGPCRYLATDSVQSTHRSTVSMPAHRTTSSTREPGARF